jgi:para-aminobenzoate synthetase component 2
LHVLILDNRDSFVWNLAQALSGLGAEVDVCRSDQTDIPAVRRMAPDALVISPGPGRPEDAGCSVSAVRELGARTPILGVCLGHQAIGAAHGADIARVAPCHGRAWPIHHRGEGLLAGLPSPFPAARYHSLAVISPHEDLVADAWTDEGVVMALHHRTNPVFGVQFHPESFLTPSGDRVLAAFLRAAAAHRLAAFEPGAAR